MITDAAEVLAPVIDHLRAANVKVHILDPDTPAEDAIERAGAVPVLIIGGMHFGAAEISRLSATDLMIRAGVGYDVIDVAAASRSGIWVANVPDFCIQEVADHTVLLLMAAMRRLPDAMNLWRSSRSWHVTAQLPPIYRVKGRRLGLVGLGRIGRLVASRAVAFGWQVAAHDPFLSPEAHREAGVEQVGLDQLFATSDAISLHCPLTDENHHLIDEERLMSMKPGVIVVNTSRGGLIDLDALDQALVSGVVSFAALDVLDGEPHPNLDHPILGRSNALVTSHTAWCSVDASRELAASTAAEALRFLDGERPINLINPEARAARA